MCNTLVIGFGNPLRRDDGAGWRVAEAVGERWDKRVSIRVGQQLVPEWAADLAEADLAFFVDASTNVRRVVLRRLARPASHQPLLDGHALAPAELLHLTQVAYGRQPAAYLLEIPAVDFRLGEDLSAAAAAGVRRAIRVLDRRLSAAIYHAQPRVQPGI